MAGILGAGTNGIVVAAAAGSVVILRNIDFNGFGTGIAGISISAAGDVRVENCKIYGFNRGIDDHRTSGHLFVSNTVVSNNVATGIVAMGGAGTLMVHLDRVQMHSNGNAGLAITGATRATVAHSWASSNVHGFYADTGAILTLEDSIATGNVTTGLNSQSGASILLFNSTVTNNGNGLSTSGGTITSFGLNRIVNNTIGNGPPTFTMATQ
jgi:hypothetical protein